MRPVHALVPSLNDCLNVCLPVCLPVCLTVCLTLLPLTARAQAPGPPPPEQLAAMKKLEWLVGQWKGEAVIEIGQGRQRTITQYEHVQIKQGGLLYLVEGKGTVRPDGQDQETTVFEALAVLSYDDMAKRYRWQAHTGGRYAEVQAEVGEKRIVWRLPRTTQGDVRYTITQTPAGEWHELGERSQDGATWTKFIELRLKKVK